MSKTLSRNLNSVRKGSSSRSERKSRRREEAYHEELHDIRLILEYKKCIGAPRGVYVIPSPENSRLWHGVIFLDSGVWGGGIFKFQIKFPDGYPREIPLIFYTSSVFHPLVNPDTGQFDTSAQYPKWKPQEHYVYHLLYYMKKVFFKTDDWQHNPAKYFNPEAIRVFKSDNREQFTNLCKRCVQDAYAERFKNERGSMLKMSKQEDEHTVAMGRILDQEQTPSYLSWFSEGVTKISKAVDKDQTARGKSSSKTNQQEDTQ